MEPQIEIKLTAFNVIEYTILSVILLVIFYYSLDVSFAICTPHIISYFPLVMQYYMRSRYEILDRDAVSATKDEVAPLIRSDSDVSEE
jgi:hypothetical protein